MSQFQSSHEQIAINTIAEEGVEIPHYASSGASGADVKAFITEDLILPAGESCLVPTGLRFAIPHGYEIQVRPRSGLALKHQLSVLNTPGTIDADYRGELKIILINFGKNDFIVTPGMRIAQLVVAPVVQAAFVETKELADTIRGHGGFGHTGTK
jgi:dUTP pyrophosphatase